MVIITTSTSEDAAMSKKKDEGEIVHIRASKVGDNGIKPDVYYTLDENGEFIEAMQHARLQTHAQIKPAA